MKKMKASEIRKAFLDFFVSKGHRIEPSASLIPYEDPTLLWINSGVATLKPYFDGRKKPENPRIVNSQKSIRTNDIENVGKTARHHTFFEMLGNFSIGDYFKKEAIHWGWEFLTSEKWIGFDPDKLHVTVHPEDEEAYQIWHEEIGIPEERIVKLEDNFWDIGEGPSGPNTEIFYDRGVSYCDSSDPECYPGGENERYLEVWNLVFSQYNHNPDGSYTPLPKKNIDTGMGLERMASVIQEVETNFDTDLFLPIIEATAHHAGVKYHESKNIDVALKVIADHIRTIVFAIGDGALPSNEGRGYVIRRLLRRAVRYGISIGIEKPFLSQFTGLVGEIMKDYYPEILGKREFIEKVIRSEEERFHETISDGLSILEQMVVQAKKEGRTEIKGHEAFKLYDTYGFPLDLTEDYAEENGLTVNQQGFERKMEEQRERARAARQEVDSMQVQGGIIGDIKDNSQFLGYNELIVDAKILYMIDAEDQLLDFITEGRRVKIILDKTPFYAESGGQIADHGVITGKNGEEIRVLDVFKAPNGQHVHTVEVVKGSFKIGDMVRAAVDENNRADIIKNHTATHLLHQALKDTLGEHVNQAGSLVAAERLRFDFSHFGAITEDELHIIEEKVNKQIWLNQPVQTMIKSLQEAKQMGAMALFGEKYGNEVRVVKVGEYSLELCGGCHVNNSAEIGLFKIISESSIGAGVRRIEAVTGKWAYQYFNQKFNMLKQIAKELKSTADDVPNKIDALHDSLRDLQKENESLKAKLSSMESKNLENNIETINGIQVLKAKLAVDMDNLRHVVDELKVKIGSGVILVAGIHQNKVNLVAAVTDDLVKQGFHAGKLIKEAAKLVGGGGGGRPDMAQAGGKEPEKVEIALNYVTEYVKSVKINI